MRILIGRRYRRRDGAISGVVASSGQTGTPHPFAADGHTYTPEGRFNASGAPSPHDLVGPPPPRAAGKLICDVTLEDYRRGVRAIRRDNDG